VVVVERISLPLLLQIIIIMISLINNSCDSDFDPYFLNCYFLKFFCVIRIFFLSILSFNI
jgi:hypothetical protein